MLDPETQQLRNSVKPPILSIKTMPHSSHHHQLSSASPGIAKIKCISQFVVSHKLSKAAALAPVHPLTPTKSEYTTIKVIEKLVENLPTDLRSNILEISRLMSTSERLLKETCDKQSTELLLLQSAHDKKNAELHTALHACEVHRRMSADMKDFKSASADSFVSNYDKKATRSNVLISKLTGPIDSLHMSQSADIKAVKQFGKKKDLGKLDCTIEESVDEEESENVGGLSESLSFIMPTSSRSVTSNASGTPSSYRKRMNLFNLSDDVNCTARVSIDPSMKDAKLRNSLLVISREKYRMTKKAEVLGDEVEILKTKLEMSELKCRHLQIDLAHMKGTDDTAPFALNLVCKSPLPLKTKDFGPVDELFKVMIERRAYNPVESILQFRRIVEVMARVPGTLNVQNVAMHMCSYKMMQILDVDMICVFITDFNFRNKIRKYTVRTDKSLDLDLDMIPSSLLSEVLKGGVHMRFSDIKQSKLFDPVTDGCPGIIVRNILSIPLKEENSGRIMGAIHFLNKYGGKVAFTELDEIFARVYGEMGVSALLGCQKLQHVSFRADVLTAILLAPSHLLQLLPGKDSLFTREIQPFEILKAIEDSTRNALRCFKVRAFLVSDRIKGMQFGNLVARDDLSSSSQSGKGSTTLQETSIQTGIAGSVADSKKLVIQLADEVNARWHPDADLDSLGLPCVTMPILDLHGDVIACVQMVLGHRSPKVSMKDSRADGFTFEQAANHLAKILSSPLESVLDAMFGEEMIPEVSEKGRQLSIITEEVKEDPCNVRTESSSTIERLVNERITSHLKHRQGLGFVEINLSVIADMEDQLRKVVREKDSDQRTITALKRDFEASQLFHSIEKKINYNEEVSTVLEAEEIAGRIREKKSHSRRRSFA